MPRTSAFSIPGHFRFSSRRPPAQIIYEAMRDAQGDAYDEDFNSRQSARMYATAITLASADLQNLRAGNNRNPAKAVELLPAHERDFQVTPPYNATVSERRRELATRARAIRGNRREAIEDGLRTLLGDDFIAYDTIDQVADIESWPASDVGDTGVFAAAGTQKKTFRLDAAISNTGIELTVPVTLLGSSQPSVAGETYCVDPDPRSNIEQITLAAVASDHSTITATFSRAHENGTLATRPHPVWISNQRYARVIVTYSAARNPEKRRKVNEFMARRARGVSRWCIVHNLGTFHFGTDGRARLGCTRLT